MRRLTSTIVAGARDRLPVRDVGHVYPCPDDVAQGCSRVPQRRLDVEQGLDGLGVGVADADADD